MKIRALVCVAVCLLMSSASYVQAQCADGCAGGCSVPLDSYFNGGDQGFASDGCATSISDRGASCGCDSNGCGAGDPACCCDSNGCDSGIGGGFGCGDAGCGIADCGGSGRGGMGGCGSGCSFAATNYLSGFGGWTDWFDLEANLTATGAINTNANLTLDTEDGFAIGAAFGRYWNDRLRSEIEFAYRDNDFDSFTASATGVGSATGNLDGNINVYSSMTNLYFDFNKIGKFQPYVGGGVGYAFVETRVNANLAGTPFSLTTETSTFAYQAMGGVTYQWTDRIDLFGEYRLFGIDDQDITLNIPGTLNANLEFEGMTHNVFFGARINM